MFISEAHAQVEGALSASNSGTSSWIMLAVLAAGFWLLIVRPQSKRQQEHTDLITGLSRGDKVVTDSGIYGEITKIVDEGIVEVEIATGVKVRLVRNAVSAVVTTETSKKVVKPAAKKVVAKKATTKKTTKKKAS
ncbi:MAG: preprotein translocase subunit YajC [Alphaproteobacteria bacterium]|jgi:preprotein translocase subunit YajC